MGGRRRGHPTVLAVAAALLVAGCAPGTEDARIIGASLAADGVTLGLSVDVCARPILEVDVVESPDEVAISLTTTSDPDGDACASSQAVTLQEPLGDRAVVDISTGDEVEVTGR